MHLYYDFEEARKIRNQHYLSFVVFFLIVCAAIVVLTTREFMTITAGLEAFENY